MSNRIQMSEGGFLPEAGKPAPGTKCPECGPHGNQGWVEILFTVMPCIACSHRASQVVSAAIDAFITKCSDADYVIEDYECESEPVDGQPWARKYRVKCWVTPRPAPAPAPVGDDPVSKLLNVRVTDIDTSALLNPSHVQRPSSGSTGRLIFPSKVLRAPAPAPAPTPTPTPPPNPNQLVDYTDADTDELLKRLKVLIDQRYPHAPQTI